MADEEMIRQQMAETRTALSEKLETLENKVTDTVKDAANAVTETVHDVKDNVHETVTAVKDSMHEGVETVKHWLDVPAHVREYPWLMVAGSVCVGYCLESMLSKSTPSTKKVPVAEAAGHARSHHVGNGGVHKRRTEPSAPAWLSQFAPEIEKLKGLAIGALLGTVREMIVQAVPEHTGRPLGDIIDSPTEKLGGDPVPSTAPASAPQDPWAARQQQGFR